MSRHWFLVAVSLLFLKVKKMIKVSLNVQHLTSTKSFFPVSMENNSSVQEIWRIPLCLECSPMPTLHALCPFYPSWRIQILSLLQALSWWISPFLAFYNPGLYSSAYHSAFYYWRKDPSVFLNNLLNYKVLEDRYHNPNLIPNSLIILAYSSST